MAPSAITNSTTDTLTTTMVALNRALSWMPMTRMAVITSAIRKAGRLKPISDPNSVGRAQQIVGPPQQVRRLRGHDIGDLRQEGLRSGHQGVVGRPRHLAGDGFSAMRSPVQ